MRDYGKVAPQFWIGRTGKLLRKSGAEAQIVALYLMTNPHANMLGMYYIAMNSIAHETGLGDEGALKGLARAIEAGFCSYDEASEVVWVHEMARFQISEQLDEKDNRCKGIQNEYDSLPGNPFLPLFFDRYASSFNMKRKREATSPIQAPSEPLRSQEQEQEHEQEVTTSSGKPDPAPLNGLKAQAVEVLEFLNAKAGRAYRPYDVNLKLIVARLKEGATVQDMKSVVAKKVREWTPDDKMREYLRPATLFNATKFAQYVGELVQ